MSDLTPYDQLADDEDELDWSWDEIADGERDRLEDDDAEAFALFAGVPEDEIEAHRQALVELAGGAD